MKTLRKIKDQVAQEHFQTSFDELVDSSRLHMAIIVCNSAAKRYAKQVLDAAAESATVKCDKVWVHSLGSYMPHPIVDKDSILKLKDQLK